MNNFLIFAFCISLFGFLGDSCGSDNTKKIQESILDKKDAGIVKKGEKIYIKDDGWNIPDLKSAKKNATSEVQIKDKSGNKRTVNITHFVANNTITEEPYSLIGYDLGKIKLFSIRKWKIDNKIFAYILSAQRVKYQEGEKKYTSFEPGFIFCYFDEDGDGKFETLINNPINDVFAPDWVLSK